MQVSHKEQKFGAHPEGTYTARDISGNFVKIRENGLFLPLFPKFLKLFLKYHGLGMCFLVAHQPFAPGETIVWYHTLLRQK